MPFPTDSTGTSPGLPGMNIVMHRLNLPHWTFGLWRRLTVPAEARLDGPRSFPLPGLHIQALDLIPMPAHP
jgi:hypothetical protein